LGNFRRRLARVYVIYIYSMMYVDIIRVYPWYPLAGGRLEHAGLAGAFSDQRPSKRGRGPVLRMTRDGVNIPGEAM
jgi:hypothetical protein